MDIRGVHTKFIEAHRSVLSQLLDLVLPQDAIDQASSASQFAQRYGFLDKPVRIRFRILDPAFPLLPGGLAQDITLRADDFAQLEHNFSRVFITENEVNFLSFPEVPQGIVRR